MPDALLKAVCSRTRQITVVEDALTAFAAGGVHAMHDATEGGVICGLWEMAASSGLQVQADLDLVPMPEDIAALAQALAFDPWCAISEGTLLAAVSENAVDSVLSAWKNKGIDGWAIGRFGASGASVTIRHEGKTSEVVEPAPDPFGTCFLPASRQTRDRAILVDYGLLPIVRTR